MYVRNQKCSLENGYNKNIFHQLQVMISRINFISTKVCERKVSLEFRLALAKCFKDYVSCQLKLFHLKNIVFINEN